MFADKKILAVIPARGGSKGLPRKNVKLLQDKPLITWSIEVAKRSELIDRVVVSTDDAEIADVAKQAGADVPFMRPEHLASDSSPTKDALIHCVQTLTEDYDILLLLQPTSPLRTLETMESCIKLSAESGKTVISVSESKKPVEWMFYRHDAGFNYVLDGVTKPTRRQDCKPVYYVDGCVYCIQIAELEASHDIFNEHSLTVVSKEQESVDIDTIQDFNYCEYLLKGNH